MWLNPIGAARVSGTCLRINKVMIVGQRSERVCPSQSFHAVSTSPAPQVAVSGGVAGVPGWCKSQGGKEGLPEL